ncbi:hypothetical protein C8255_15025 [filamentous cyanobacterium CCP3]|nr:hypothetical protein C8255_15025 [filamentous cyanobacterium CCP3]
MITTQSIPASPRKPGDRATISPSANSPHYSGAPIDATVTGETATFMGRPYARKPFTVAQRQQPAELTYHGIRYAR